MNIDDYISFEIIEHEAASGFVEFQEGRMIASLIDIEYIIEQELYLDENTDKAEILLEIGFKSGKNVILNSKSSIKLNIDLKLGFKKIMVNIL